MDWDTWQGLYRRLSASRGRTVNGEQAAAYYVALSRYPAPVVEQAIAKANHEHKPWPTVPVLCEFARGIVAGLPAPAAMCDLCHGETWIEAAAPSGTPEFAQAYRHVTRCPQCWTLGRTPTPAYAGQEDG